MSLEFKIIPMQERVREEILEEVGLGTLVRGSCFSDFVMATAIEDLVNVLPHAWPKDATLCMLIL